MTCDLIQSQLTALLDGELPGESVAEIEAHLRACPDCTEARETLAALSEPLAAWTVRAPDITPAVMQAVTTDEMVLLRAEMRELRAEIRLLRDEVAALRRPALPPWFPATAAPYTRTEENDPWNFVRS